MTRTFASTLLLTVTLLAFANTSAAQERFVLPAKSAKLDSESVIDQKIIDTNVRLNARMAKALDSDPILKAAIEKDLRPILNEKNPAKRLALAKAFRAAHERDIQRVLAKGGFDLNSSVKAFEGIDPSVSVAAVNGAQVLRRRAPEASAAQTPPPAPVGGTVKELVSADFQFEQFTDCAPGQGRSERSGGYLISETERCSTWGRMTHELEVPAGYQARVEMRANLSSEAHAIMSFAHSSSRISIVRGTETVETRESNADLPNTTGDDAGHSLDGATIIRQLPPGKYTLVSKTSSITCTFPFGWAVAEGKVSALRVKITMTPQ
ncbi:hypothetical protein [Asticcacaulis sp. YBE204]|uniref:hypothetical protein n=1 Tax=Asticcacaulis sp. YBE204 TaxID=1282363 RepID=UPI0003C3E197|nr:hypothetical protein [Asticcacaulis sp. YBE204]ESQ78692.1 hypothetical protein AEYBE204_11955 [Asticcacaulis sp. YBE204]